MPRKTEVDKLREWYAKELERRDNQIDQLKTENMLLMKTSLKQSERAHRWTEYAKNLQKKAKDI